MKAVMGALSLNDLVAILAGAGALAGALGVVLARRAFRAVLGLLVTIVSLSVLYLTLAAPVIAFVQILVYAGAVVVLFLFVVMLLDLGKTGAEAPGRGPIRLTWAVGLTAVLFAAATAPLALTAAWWRPPAAAVPVEAADVGRALFTRYLISFEAAAVYLLAAVVAAVYIAHHREPGERSRPDERPAAGEAGTPASPPLVEAGKEA